MSVGWYPLKKEELKQILDELLKKELIKKHKTSELNGLIIPHAGYEYSGKIAAKAYSYLKNSKKKKAIILAPSHYFPLHGAVTHNEPTWQTPLGEIKISSKKNIFRKANLTQEHAIDNQIPFLQKLGFKEILPIVIGELNNSEAEMLAIQLNEYKKDFIFLISTDLSHFLPENYAKIRDKQTIEIITSLNETNISKIDACGIFPLTVLIKLCKINNWKPKLVDYATSADITQDTSKVVGYASFKF